MGSKKRSSSGQPRDALGRFTSSSRGFSQGRDALGRFTKRERTEPKKSRNSAPKPNPPKKPTGGFRDKTRDRLETKPAKLKTKQSKKVAKGGFRERARDALGRFKSNKPVAKTTAEKRDTFYAPLSKAEVKKLPKDSTLTPAKAKKKADAVLSRVRDHFGALGFEVHMRSVLNRDNTYDGDVMVVTAGQTFEARDPQTEAEYILNQIASTVSAIDPDIWFSIRTHYETTMVVDEDGDEALGSLVYDMVTGDMLSPDYVLKEHRWKSQVLQTAWQRTKPNLYSNVQGAIATSDAMHTKFSRYQASLSKFTFKLSWNFQVVPPPKLR